MRPSKRVRQRGIDGQRGGTLEYRKPGVFFRKVFQVTARKPRELSSFAKAPESERPSTPERRQEIITSYLNTLDCLKSPIRSESDLPFSREAIQTAIIEELVKNPETDLRGQLEIAYAEIESFIPVEEYELLRRFKESCSQVEQLAERGDPGDIVACSRLVDRNFGEKAVGVLERISRAMGEQLQTIRSIGMMHTSMGFENASS